MERNTITRPGESTEERTGDVFHLGGVKEQPEDGIPHRDPVYGESELTVEALPGNVGLVTDYVNERIEDTGCDMNTQLQIEMAIEELFVNIAQYAYNPETGAATVRVEVPKDPLSVVITFIDNGKPYDPLAKEDPDIDQEAADGIGGLGIFMVKKFMDGVSYEYKDGQNILKIKKNI